MDSLQAIAKKNNYYMFNVGGQMGMELWQIMNVVRYMKLVQLKRFPVTYTSSRLAQCYYYYYYYYYINTICVMENVYPDPDIEGGHCVHL